MSIKYNGQYQDIGSLGSEDLLDIIQGAQEYETSFTYFAPTLSTFLVYCVDAANFATPASTISTSLSMIFSIYLNGVENYIVLAGSRVKDVSIKMEVGKATAITVNMVHTSITLPSATPTAGLTLTATVTGPVQTWVDGGTAPFSWDGTGRDCKAFTININRNTKPEHTLGNLNPYGTISHGRRISGDFSVLWTDNDLETDFGTPTASGKTIIATLDTGVYTLTITGARITDYTKDYDTEAGEAILENCTFRGTVITAS